MPPTRKILKEVREIEGLDIPLFIYFDAGKNARVRLKDYHAELTVPVFVPESEEQYYVEWAINWVRKKLDQGESKAKKPAVILQDGYEMKIMEEVYTLKVKIDPYIVNPTIEFKGDSEFLCSMPRNMSEEETQDALHYLLRKIIANKFRKPLIERVMKLNERLFGFEIKDLKLKYNKSNWGSCSSKGNLNFSIRLLFAPLQVIDSVIIHELAHFEHMNHSPKFWALVKKNDPNMASSDLWLKEHARTEFI